MISRLDQVARNIYSQHGEDGMIAWVLDRLGPKHQEHKVCVDIGASDGVSGSNTKWLRDQGYEALLIEKNPELARKIARNQFDQVVAEGATPDNINDLVGKFVDGRPIAVMSIDVDGADYALFDALISRPILMVIEFNCSVPPDADLRQEGTEGRFGASALSLKRLGEKKGYSVLGVSMTNLFLILKPYEQCFNYLETDLNVLLGKRKYSVVATDYDGNPVMVNHDTHYWGFRGYGWSTPVLRTP